MSIFAYTGAPGAGKSYNAIEQVVLPALKAGRTVVTNIPLRLPELRAVCPDGTVVEFPTQAVSQDPDSIRQYVTPGCVFVLDEVWRIWPAGQKTDKVPEAFKSLLAEHRHMVNGAGDSVSITLIVQDLANIGSFARRLVEKTYIHTKLSHVGMDRRFRVDIFQGAVTGTVGPQSNRLREIVGAYKPEVYALYQSHTMSESATSGANEKHVDRRANVLRKPALVVGALCVPLLLVGGIWGVQRFLHHPGPTLAAATGQKAPQGLASGPQSGFLTSVGQRAPQAISPAPRPYRVIGVVVNLSDPSRSIAAVQGSGRDLVVRPLERCRHVLGEPMQCELEGTYYSETGLALSAVVNQPLPPVTVADAVPVAQP